MNSEFPDNSKSSVGAPATAAKIAELCAQTELLLMQHGTESAVVESLTRRLGIALGADAVDVALMANAATITVAKTGESVTVVRRNRDRGINVHLAMEVQQLVLATEAGEISPGEYEEKLTAIKPFHYSRPLVIFAIGISCACFAGLAGADLSGSLIVFLAGSLAMATRQFLAGARINPIIGFFVAAFVATSVTVQSVLLGLSQTPKSTIAAGMLLLVPGFPLLTGISDTVKGFVNIGISRVMIALRLAVAASAGVILSLNVRGFSERWHAATAATTAVTAASATFTGILFGLGWDMLLAAVPATGFAVLFNVPVRTLIFAASGGACGHGLRWLLLPAGIPIEWGSLVAATVISTGCVLLARRLHVHPKVFSIAAMIPMVPGVPFFTALIAWHELNRHGFNGEIFASAVSASLLTLFIMTALAFGLAMPGMLFYRRKPSI